MIHTTLTPKIVWASHLKDVCAFPALSILSPQQDISKILQDTGMPDFCLRTVSGLLAQEAKGPQVVSLPFFPENEEAPSARTLIAGRWPENCTGPALSSWVKKLADSIFATKSKDIGLVIDNIPAKECLTFLEMLLLALYRFHHYRTQNPFSPAETAPLQTLHVFTSHENLESSWMPHQHLVEAVYLARDLVNEPSNVATPAAIVEQAEKLRQLGVNVEVLNKEALAAKGMSALLGVAQGSALEPFVVTLSWQGTSSDQAPIALVGKGVTFDTGGISLKPSDGMEEMKGDMAGAAAVLATLQALASRRSPVNVVGTLALVENMPSGTAQRPGDIVHSMSGQSIEVLNTDAEGRLILADALWYTQEKFTPRTIIDIATLTGAIRVALGPVFGGLFSNDDALANALLQAGERTGDFLWRMPLHDTYDKAINSPIADVKNIADRGVGAGSSTGAHFLKRFIKKDMPWAHLDIASVSGGPKPTDLSPAGGTGFGVRLFVALLEDILQRP